MDRRHDDMQDDLWNFQLPGPAAAAGGVPDRRNRQARNPRNPRPARPLQGQGRGQGQHVANGHARPVLFWGRSLWTLIYEEIRFLVAYVLVAGLIVAVTLYFNGRDFDCLTVVVPMVACYVFLQIFRRDAFW
ncbi:uncharacterized protein LOC143290175 [Babylonia areolata]|uniref:uncharacterized protein LOC143290175 n=1 Tax=Babylonia areolata TaxID=304850 RepID=UPI003FD5F2DB